MILDNYLMFTGTSNGASGGITSSALLDAPTTGTQAASNIIDLGVVLGLPSYANGGGARDIAPGYSLLLSCIVNTTFTSGTSLALSLSGAPDDGSGGVGSYTIMWTGPAVLEASLLAGTQIANIEIPRPVPGQVLPRFLKLSFITVGTHVTGKVGANIVLDRFDQIVGAAGNLSGYPAGINIAN
jgi:hypothetical protein